MDMDGSTPMELLMSGSPPLAEMTDNDAMVDGEEEEDEEEIDVPPKMPTPTPVPVPAPVPAPVPVPVPPPEHLPAATLAAAAAAAAAIAPTSPPEVTSPTGLLDTPEEHTPDEYTVCIL